MSGGRGTLRPVAAWLALLGLCVVLDGVAGAAAAVLVGALLLAKAPLRWLGITGVVALAVVPIVVLGGGLPSAGEVSPTFVSRTLVPHHLTFAGLVLVSTWAVLELVPHLGDRRSSEEAPGARGPAQGDGEDAGAARARLAAGLLLVGAVALGAVVAVQAVLQA